MNVLKDSVSQCWMSILSEGIVTEVLLWHFCETSALRIPLHNNSLLDAGCSQRINAFPCIISWPGEDPGGEDEQEVSLTNQVGCGIWQADYPQCE